MVLLSRGAAGQTAPQPAFEVASIKPAPPQAPGRVSTRMSTDTGRLTYTNVSLTDLIGQAYGVAHHQVSGPAWLDSERFDIVAKFPSGVSQDQVPRMFQALLADRFGVQLHRETKEMAVYALVVARNGPKLEKADQASGIGGHLSPARNQLTGKITMSRFADYLSDRLGRTVLNQTGLEGPWSVALDWVSEDAPPDASGASIFTALQEQLGLRLVATKGQVEILVIDRAEKVPTEN